jgi:hypothetical protein
MNFKDDLFALYKGKEYRLAISKDKELRLVSSDVSDLEIGFFERSPGLYVLNVKKEDLESYYRVSTSVRYKGFDFGIWSTEGDKILISRDCDWHLAQKLGLEPSDKGIYEKWVKEEDLEKVWEEKSSLEL